MSAAFVSSGLLLLPSAGYALIRLLGRPAPELPHTLHKFRPSLVIFLLPVVVLIGYWVSGISGWALFFLPVLHVLAVGIPVLWILFLGTRNLPLGSPQRMWGVFGSGLVLGPFLIMIGEALALFLFFAVGVALISTQPGLLEELTTLSEWLITTNPSPDMLVERLTPYLTHPAIILFIFFFASVIVPLIEEALKPIGVWLLFGRDLTPATGFAAGAISGSGYALFESLALTSTGEDWALVVVARMGTAVIHILTAGFTGWALVQAWRFGRYRRLGLTYLGAVLAHGTWNGLAVLAALTALGESTLQIEIHPVISFFGQLAPFALFLITAAAFVALLWANRTFTQTIPNDSEQEYSLETG